MRYKYRQNNTWTEHTYRCTLYIIFNPNLNKMNALKLERDKTIVTIVS